MKKIVLVCNAGMSTGILAKKMEAAANGEYEIKAYGDKDFQNNLENAEVILVGPQIRYMIEDIKKDYDIPVAGINPMKYGMMDGKGVLEDAIKLMK